ncbi:hypothetical protein MWU59_11060 [Flavobacteriaceae bacterium F08102]|nr:hypothetical protein [Flavobacteriaceae bacterium F08102]
MNITEFTRLLQDPSSISSDQTKEMEDILDNYPYFQAARLIHLKGLKRQHSFKYNTALKEAAAHTTNRTVLFDFVTNDTLDATNKLEKTKQLINETEIIDVEVLSKSNAIQTTNATDETDEITSKYDAPPKKKIQLLEEKLDVGKPLNFNHSEIHSFNEWLQLTKAKPIIRETQVNEPEEKPDITESISTQASPEKEKKFELISQFINTKAKLAPTISDDQTDISIESTIENENLMTETLARVYLEQKKYAKAIQAFKILSLKYPEKSGFFADRIKAVKFLQQNNT